MLYPIGANFKCKALFGPTTLDESRVRTLNLSLISSSCVSHRHRILKGAFKKQLQVRYTTHTPR